MPLVAIIAKLYHDFAQQRRVLTSNLGPDIGAGSEFAGLLIVSTLLPETLRIRKILEQWITYIAMDTSHNAFCFVVVWCPILAFLCYKAQKLPALLTRKRTASQAPSRIIVHVDSDSDDAQSPVDSVPGQSDELELETGLRYTKEEQPSSLSFDYWQMLMLVTAGGLSHFLYDTIFEENGKSRIYRWILSTGFWPEEQNGQSANRFDFWTGFMLLTTLAGLIGSLVFISRRFSKREQSKEKFVYTLCCFGLVVLVYLAYCFLRVYIIKPRFPAMGEEADLGAIVFMAIFALGPILLCLDSMASPITHAPPAEQELSSNVRLRTNQE